MDHSFTVSNKSSRVFYLTIFLLSLLIGLSGTWDRDFSTRGEGREALVAQNMFTTNNWILPSGYGGAVPSKPPAMHWGIALFSLVAGDVNEFTARLPSFLSMFVFLLFFFRFIENRVGKREAFLSTLILLTSFEWFRAGTTCRVDMLLSASFAGGLIALFVWEEKGLSRMPWLAILLLTVATLCKGPVAIVLPVAIFAAYLWLRGNSLKKIAISLSRVFIPVFLCASIWYFAAYLIERDRFLERVYYENIARFLGTAEDEPHKHSVLYLYGMIPLGSMPWSLIIIPLLFFSSARTKIVSLIKNWRNFSKLSLYCLIVVFACIAFFSIPSSKRGVYLLPMYPFFAFLLSQLLFLCLEESTLIAKFLTRSLISIAFVSVLLGLTTSLALEYFNIHILDQLHSIFNLNIAPVLIDMTNFLYASWGIFEFLLVVIFILIGVIYFRKSEKLVSEEWIFRYGIYVALTVSLVSWSILRPINNKISSKSLANNLPREMVSGKEIVSFKNSFYGLSFYLKHQLSMKSKDFTSGSLVIMYEDQLKNFSELIGANQRAEVLFTSPFGVEHFTRRLLVVNVTS